MKNYSTLMYFVNNFQSDLEKNEMGSVGNNFDNSLIKMDQSKRLPSGRTIANILSFARSYKVMQTKSKGYVEMILN